MIMYYVCLWREEMTEVSGGGWASSDPSHSPSGFQARVGTPRRTEAISNKPLIKYTSNYQDTLSSKYS